MNKNLIPGRPEAAAIVNSTSLLSSSSRLSGEGSPVTNCTWLLFAPCTCLTSSACTAACNPVGVSCAHPHSQATSLSHSIPQQCPTSLASSPYLSIRGSFTGIKASSTSAPGDKPTFWPLSQLGLSRCVDGFGWSPAGGQIGSCWWVMATGPPTPTPLLSYSTQLGLGNLSHP